MELKFILAVLAGLMYWWGHQMVLYSWIDRFTWYPLIHAFVYGIITGRMQECMIIGSAISVLYVSLVAAGGNLPADSTAAGTIAIPIALMNNYDVATAVTLAATVAILGNLILPIQFNMMNIITHVADKHAAEGDFKGLYRTNFLAWIIVFILRFPAAFATVYYGAGVIDVVMKILPEWIVNGLTVAGGILPSLGIAATLFVINKPQYIPIFLIGYFFVVLFDISLIGAAIFGIGGIVLYTILKVEAQKEAAVADDVE
ncbi:MAG: PTS mannose/fructose/sorbose/N-acetylgalactosamine transporter subunit IIC [Erysipelotrichaceae bacterium]|jgi:D-glucosaminate-specific PTS system IIC component